MSERERVLLSKIGAKKWLLSFSFFSVFLFFSYPTQNYLIMTDQTTIEGRPISDFFSSQFEIIRFFMSEQKQSENNGLRIGRGVSPAIKEQKKKKSECSFNGLSH